MIQFLALTFLFFTQLFHLSSLTTTWNISIPHCSTHGGFAENIILPKYSILNGMSCHEQHKLTDNLVSIDCNDGKVLFNQEGVSNINEGFFPPNKPNIVVSLGGEKIQAYDIENQKVIWNITLGDFFDKIKNVVGFWHKDNVVFFQLEIYFDIYLPIGAVTIGENKLKWVYYYPEEALFLNFYNDEIYFLPILAEGNVKVLNINSGNVTRTIALEDPKRVIHYGPPVDVVVDGDLMYFGIEMKYVFKKQKFYMFAYNKDKGGQVWNQVITPTDKYLSSPFYRIIDDNIYVVAFQQGYTLIYAIDKVKGYVQWKVEAPGGEGEIVYCDTASIIEIKGLKYIYVDCWQNGYVVSIKNGEVLTKLKFIEEFKAGPYFLDDGYVYGATSWGDVATYSKTLFDGWKP